MLGVLKVVEDSKPAGWVPLSPLHMNNLLGNGRCSTDDAWYDSVRRRTKETSSEPRPEVPIDRTQRTRMPSEGFVIESWHDDRA